MRWGAHQPLGMPPTRCTSPPLPVVCLAQECKNTDYEEWSPPRPETCLLGRNFTMKRRKREASCFNSYDFDDVSGTYDAG